MQLAFPSTVQLSKENLGEVSFPSLHLSSPICKMQQLALPALTVWDMCSQTSPQLAWVSGGEVCWGPEKADRIT